MGGIEGMSNGFTDTQTLLYALADLVGMNLLTEKYEIHGSAKRKIDLFEGFSPTICPTVESSCLSASSGVVAIQGQLWGNLGFVATVEDYRNLVTFFLYDRSKAPENKNCTPFQETGWSRKRLYYWLEKSVKGIYARSMFDTVFTEVNPSRIAKYNEARDKNTPARDAWELVWGDVV